MSTSESGFTYLEVLLAVVILAGGATSAAYALSQVRLTGEVGDRASTARYLIQDGTAWLRSLQRIDDTQPVFGVEAGETVIDDVDDLDGRIEANVKDLAGNSFSGWTRTWTVDSASLVDPRITVADGSTPLLRVRIDLSFGGTLLGSETLLLARTP